MNMSHLLHALPLALAFACRAPEDRSRALEPQCLASYEDEARAVVAQHASCESDADCVLVQGPGCLSPLLCYGAVAREKEGAFAFAGEALISDYIDECGPFCAEADCVSESQLRAVCDTGTGLCGAAFASEPTMEVVGGAP